MYYFPLLECFLINWVLFLFSNFLPHKWKFIGNQPDSYQAERLLPQWLSYN
jgi:hypothetical protein